MHSLIYWRTSISASKLHAYIVKTEVFKDHILMVLSTGHKIQVLKYLVTVLL